MYKRQEVATIHAGLECGLFAGKLEGLDSVSFGPAMGHVHSVNEYLNIESVGRMWEYLKAVLKLSLIHILSLPVSSVQAATTSSEEQNYPVSYTHLDVYKRQVLM